MNTLETIEGVPILADDEKTLISFLAMAMIDGDGSGPSLGDPDFQSDTTLHWNGLPLDATVDRFIVIPPQLIQDVPGIVLGCLAFVLNTKTKLWTWAVVGDVGPHVKIGEMAIATAQAIGIPSNPTTGGLSDHCVQYLIWPGVAAQILGKQYQLKPSRVG